MIGARVDLQLAVHRVAHFGLRQHAANRLFDPPPWLPCANVHGALFAEAAFVSAVPPVELLLLLASGELHLGGFTTTTKSPVSMNCV